MVRTKVNSMARKAAFDRGLGVIEESQMTNILLYILENDNDKADAEDLSQLLQMVFSPDGPDEILLGTSAPRHHLDSDEEMIGAPADASGSSASSDVINEDMASLDALLNELVDTDDTDDEEIIG